MLEGNLTKDRKTRVFDLVGACWWMLQGSRSDERNTTSSPNQPINPKSGHSLHSPSPSIPLTQLLLACSFATRELVGNKKESCLRRSRGTIRDRCGGSLYPFLGAKGRIKLTENENTILRQNPKPLFSSFCGLASHLPSSSLNSFL